jgi:hypothetical protein
MNAAEHFRAAEQETRWAVDATNVHLCTEHWTGAVAHALLGLLAMQGHERAWAAMRRDPIGPDQFQDLGNDAAVELNAAWRRVLYPVPGPAGPVGDLLARMKTLEARHGSWPGADTVDVLTEWFRDHGVDPDADLPRGD